MKEKPVLVTIQFENTEEVSLNIGTITSLSSIVFSDISMNRFIINEDSGYRHVARSTEMVLYKNELSEDNNFLFSGMNPWERLLAYNDITHVFIRDEEQGIGVDWGDDLDENPNQKTKVFNDEPKNGPYVVIKIKEEESD